MIVYICCAGGATSGMLCTKIKAAASKEMKIHIDSIDYVLKEVSNGGLKGFDIIFAYGAASLVTKNYIKDRDFDKYIDLILVSPQVRFEIPRIKDVVLPYNIPCEGIDMRTFGVMNGGKILDIILDYKSKLVK